VCVDTFFDSQGVVHKEFVQEGKAVNAEFYKGLMKRLLMGIQRVRPAAFCYRDFFLLHDNAPPPPQSCMCLQIFDPKYVTTLYPPPSFSPDLSPPEYFPSPKLKMKLQGLHFADVAEIQEVVTDESKKVQQEEFSAAFQKLCDRVKSCAYIPMEFILNKKRHVSSTFFKNQS
jgi:hypothetical protein